jgi:hypothetical protein
MAITAKFYRGMPYRLTKFEGMSIYEGYDRGCRVVYALSLKEFHGKVEKYQSTGATNQATPWNRRKWRS